MEEILLKKRVCLFQKLRIQGDHSIIETTTLVHLLQAATFSQAIIKIDIGEAPFTSQQLKIHVSVHSRLHFVRVIVLMLSIHILPPPNAEYVMTRV